MPYSSDYCSMTGKMFYNIEATRKRACSCSVPLSHNSVPSVRRIVGFLAISALLVVHLAAKVPWFASNDVATLANEAVASLV